MRWSRLLWIVLAVLLGLLQYRLWWARGGSRSVSDLRAQVQAQVRENEGLQQRNDALAAEVEDLKSGEAVVEERARSELGMIKPGETFYRIVDRTEATVGEPSAARVAEANAAAAAATAANAAKGLPPVVEEPPEEELPPEDLPPGAPGH